MNNNIYSASMFAFSRRLFMLCEGGMYFEMSLYRVGNPPIEKPFIKIWKKIMNIYPLVYGTSDINN